MAQEHFIDLCRLLDHPTPAEADPSRTWYTFEAGATKATGGQGYADVWKRDCFAWEYKGDHADLDKAYGQLLLYSGALANPPLLIVCDGHRFRIHTHFTHTVRRHLRVHPRRPVAAGQARSAAQSLHRPGGAALARHHRPGHEQAAAHFARIAQVLRRYDHPAPAVAHFLIRLLFCLVAEDIGILPADLFSRLATRPQQNAAAFAAQLRQLFAAMATGGFFGVETIKHVDGGTIQRRQRPAAGCRQPAHSGRGVRVELVGHRAEHLRHAVRARPGSGRNARSSARTTPATRTSCWSSSRC